MNINKYACFKRSLDWYAADAAFRHLMDSDPEKTVDRLGFTGIIEPDAVRQAIHDLLFTGHCSDNIYVREFHELQKPVIEENKNVHSRECIADEQLFFYLDTQRNRCRMESSLIREHPQIYYFPFAFELSRGCSPQCDFCGLGADPYGGSFLYTPENARLFRDVLAALYRYAGRITGYCPCYFATEPFDNPDYELFMDDVKAVTGHIPQTTTALAHTDPVRVKRWMEVSGGYENRASMRFSVCSSVQFREIMRHYSPLDLLYVELIANNKGSVNRYSYSGRARHSEKNRRAADYSISCVAGIKINMPDRTAEFIRPEIPCDEYPTGYRVMARSVFSDASDFECVLRKYADRFATGLLRDDVPLCVNRHVAVRKTGEDSAVFVNRHDGTPYEPESVPGLAEMTEYIRLHLSFSECAEKAGLSSAEKAACAEVFGRLVQRGYVDYYI